jgi:hypothetical protein
VSINTDAVKTFLLALTAAVFFVAAIVVGLGPSAKKAAPDDQSSRTTISRNSG